MADAWIERSDVNGRVTTTWLDSSSSKPQASSCVISAPKTKDKRAYVLELLASDSDSSTKLKKYLL